VQRDPSCSKGLRLPVAVLFKKPFLPGLGMGGAGFFLGRTANSWASSLRIRAERGRGAAVIPTPRCRQYAPLVEDYPRAIWMARPWRTGSPSAMGLSWGCGNASVCSGSWAFGCASRVLAWRRPTRHGRRRIKKLQALMADPAVDLWASDEVHFQQHGSRCRMWIPAETKDPFLLHAPAPPLLAQSLLSTTGCCDRGGGGRVRRLGRPQRKPARSMRNYLRRCV
jgi:hypothetical protein